MKAQKPRTDHITASFLTADSFKPRGGLRSFLAYRDLGVSAATGGRFGATVARAVQAYKAGGGTPRHVHRLRFHLIYVLKGWLRTEFEGLGEIVLRAGDCVYCPGGVPQTHIEYSDDYEVLQVTVPADYPTLEVGAGPSGRRRARVAARLPGRVAVARRPARAASRKPARKAARPARRPAR